MKLTTFAFSCLCLLISIPCFGSIDYRHLNNEQWREIQSDNIRVITNGDSRMGHAIAQDLERFRWFISLYMGIDDTAVVPPFTLLALADDKSYRALGLSKQFSGTFYTDEEGSFAIANATGYSTNGSLHTTGNHTVMHEYTHFIAATLLGQNYYPTWYNEAIAEYLSTFREIHKDTLFELGRLDIIGAREGALRIPGTNQFESVDVEDLFKSKGVHHAWREHGSKQTPDKQHTGKFYARAVMTYHYLKSNNYLNTQLNDFITLLNEGLAVDAAFDVAFNGISYATLDAAINDYMRTSTGSGAIQYSVGSGIPSTPYFATQERTLSSDEAILNVASYLFRTNAHTDKALQPMLSWLDNKYPYSKALMYSKLLRLEAKNVELHTLYNTLVSMRQLYPDHLPFQTLQAALDTQLLKSKVDVGSPQTPQLVADIRARLSQAIAANPFNTRAYSTLTALAAISNETQGQHLKAACDAAAKRRALQKDRDHDLRNELSCRVQLNDMQSATLLIRKIAARDTNDEAHQHWISKGYGRFILETLNMRALALSEPVNGSARELSYADGSVYNGDIEDDRPHGYGRFQSVYYGDAEGYWQHGLLVEAKQWTTTNRYRYEGKLNNGVISGYGTLYYPEGDIDYSEGRFILGFAHGNHTQHFHSGLTLRGNIYMNQRLGRFDATLPKGTNGYVDMINGRVKIRLSEDDYFIGEFTADGYLTGEGWRYQPVIEKITSWRLNKRPWILYKNTKK